MCNIKHFNRKTRILNTDKIEGVLGAQQNSASTWGICERVHAHEAVHGPGPAWPAAYPSARGQRGIGARPSVFMFYVSLVHSHKFSHVRNLHVFSSLYMVPPHNDLCSLCLTGMFSFVLNSKWKCGNQNDPLATSIWKEFPFKMTNKYKLHQTAHTESA